MYLYGSSLKAALSLSFAQHNFVRIHQPLRATPTMSAQLGDHLSSMEELLHWTTQSSGSSKCLRKIYLYGKRHLPAQGIYSTMVLDKTRKSKWLTVPRPIGRELMPYAVSLN